MNLKNIARDSFWLGTIKDTAIAFSSNTGDLVNSDGTVYSDVGSVSSSGSSSATGDSAIGVFMANPLIDPVPYRVKAYVPTNDNIYLAIARAPATITGTDDAMAHIHRMHLIGEIDEVFMIDPLDSGDADYEKPICFALQVFGVAVGSVHLSVQKLDVAPPQFAIAVP